MTLYPNIIFVIPVLYNTALHAALHPALLDEVPMYTSQDFLWTATTTQSTVYQEENLPTSLTSLIDPSDTNEIELRHSPCDVHYLCEVVVTKTAQQEQVSLLPLPLLLPLFLPLLLPLLLPPLPLTLTPTP